MLQQLKAWIKESGREMGYGYSWFDDAFLLRFCRARKFDLEKIQEMWANYMNYRKENDLDNLCLTF